MWVPAARAQLTRDDIPYAASLTDVDWAVVAPFMFQPAKTGRTRVWPMHLVSGSWLSHVAGRVRWTRGTGRGA